MKVPSPHPDHFSKDVSTGLTSYPKFLSSKYFYDEQGDQLFQEIMKLPEYYLTGAEYDTLSENAAELGKLFSLDNGFELIELGAGDGTKMKVLIRSFLKQGLEFTYHPLDISPHVLDQLSSELKEEFPGLEVKPVQGQYLQALEDLELSGKRRQVLAFLGSNLGNFSQEEAVVFLKKIGGKMSSQDLLFIGIDKKKEPSKILAAYNDSKGVTAAFNKNLLHRINKELDGNFDPDLFFHWPVYDPESGVVTSYLVSSTSHVVQLRKLNLEVAFAQWEPVKTEISVKYNQRDMEKLLEKAGLRILKHFSDRKALFSNYIIQKC